MNQFLVVSWASSLFREPVLDGFMSQSLVSFMNMFLIWFHVSDLCFMNQFLMVSWASSWFHESDLGLMIQVLVSWISFLFKEPALRFMNHAKVKTRGIFVRLVRTYVGCMSGGRKYWLTYIHYLQTGYILPPNTKARCFISSSRFSKPNVAEIFLMIVVANYLMILKSIFSKKICKNLESDICTNWYCWKLHSSKLLTTDH